MNRLIHHALSLVVPQFRLCPRTSNHGIQHWVRVWKNARDLCRVYDVDPTVPCLFAFLHDSQRYDDYADFEHGDRAVVFVQQLYADRKIDVSPMNLHHLVTAIAGHSFGGTEADRIVQICWDADRLDLGRVGVIPNPMYLCTEHAKRPEVIQEAVRLSLSEHKNS